MKMEAKIYSEMLLAVRWCTLYNKLSCNFVFVKDFNWFCSLGTVTPFLDQNETKTMKCC